MASKISKTKSGKGTKRSERRKSSSPRGRRSPESDDSKDAAKQFDREDESAIWKLREQRAKRAYELYLRGGSPGRPCFGRLDRGRAPDSRRRSPRGQPFLKRGDVRMGVRMECCSYAGSSGEEGAMPRGETPVRVSPLILKGLEVVRRSRETSMFDLPSVASVAERFGDLDTAAGYLSISGITRKGCSGASNPPSRECTSDRDVPKVARPLGPLRRAAGRAGERQVEARSSEHETRRRNASDR